MDSRICSLLSHFLSLTNSRSIWPTSATGPPNPRKPSRKKYSTSSAMRPRSGTAVDVISKLPLSLRIGNRLKYAVQGRSQSDRCERESLTGPRHFEAAVVRLLEIEAELVLIDDPLSALLQSHRKASQRPIAFIGETVVHLIGELHSCELRPDLRSGQLLNAFRGDKSGIESNQARDAGKYRDQTQTA